MSGGGQGGMGGPSGGGFGSGQSGFGGAQPGGAGGFSGTMGGTGSGPGGLGTAYLGGTGGFGGGFGGGRFSNFMQNFGGRLGQPAPGGGFFGGRGGATPGGYLNSLTPPPAGLPVMPPDFGMPPPAGLPVMPPDFGMPPPAGLPVEPGPVGTGEYTGDMGGLPPEFGDYMPPSIMPPGFDTPTPVMEIGNGITPGRPRGPYLQPAVMPPQNPPAGDTTTIENYSAPRLPLSVMSSRDLNLNTGLPSQMGTAQTGFMPTNQFMSLYPDLFNSQYSGGMGGRGTIPPSPLQTGGRSGPFIPTGNLPIASLPNPRTPQTGGVIGPMVPRGTVPRSIFDNPRNPRTGGVIGPYRRRFAEGGIASLRYAEGGPARDERGFLLNPVYDEFGFDQEGNTRFGRDPNLRYELEKKIPFRNTKPTSAQQAYDMTLQIGMSPEYKAWFDSMPQHLKAGYLIHPASGPNDPRWIGIAEGNRASFERYGNENPFDRGRKTTQKTQMAKPDYSKMRGSNQGYRQAQPTNKTMTAPPPAAPTAPMAPMAPTAPAAQYQDIPLAVNQNMSNMPTSAPPPGPMAPPPAPMMAPPQQTGGFSLQDYINSMQIPEAARRRAAKSDMAERIASRIAASDKGIAGLKK